MPLRANEGSEFDDKCRNKAKVIKMNRCDHRRMTASNVQVCSRRTYVAAWSGVVEKVAGHFREMEMAGLVSRPHFAFACSPTHATSS